MDKFYSLTLKIMTAAVIIAAVSYFLTLYISGKNQLEHARRTLGITRQLAVWQAQTNNDFPREKTEDDFPLNWLGIYNKKVYQSLNYRFVISNERDNIYVFAYAKTDDFASIPHAFFLDADRETLFCLALKESSKAQKLCKALGGKEYDGPDLHMPAVFLENGPGTANYKFYLLNQDDFPPPWPEGFD